MAGVEQCTYDICQNKAARMGATFHSGFGPR